MICCCWCYCCFTWMTFVVVIGYETSFTCARRYKMWRAHCVMQSKARRCCSACLWWLRHNAQTISWDVRMSGARASKCHKKCEFSCNAHSRVCYPMPRWIPLTFVVRSSKAQSATLQWKGVRMYFIFCTFCVSWDLEITQRSKFK